MIVICRASIILRWCLMLPECLRDLKLIHDESSNFLSPPFLKQWDSDTTEAFMKSLYSCEFHPSIRRSYCSVSLICCQIIEAQQCLQCRVDKDTTAASLIVLFCRLVVQLYQYGFSMLSWRTARKVRLDCKLDTNTNKTRRVNCKISLKRLALFGF